MLVSIFAITSSPPVESETTVYYAFLVDSGAEDQGASSARVFTGPVL